MQGITVQQTAPYAHQQNGKIERYVRTIEEGGQALLADSGLPMTFWGWAVLTSQYLRNRLPTSTLPVNVTPIEAISGKKPDLSHLRVWGSQCFVAIPPELRTKGGPRRFEGIFVGYEEARIGWSVQDKNGKLHFSRDVIFNEDLSGRLGIQRTISSPVTVHDGPPASVRPIRTRIRTIAGRDYDEVLRLRDQRFLARTHARHSASDRDASDGGDIGDTALLVSDCGTTGGALVDTWSVSEDTLGDLVSLIASSDFPAPVETSSLVLDEEDISWNQSLLQYPKFSIHVPDFTALVASVEEHSCLISRSFDLSKEPRSYSEAMKRPDADAWCAAMDREKTSLREMDTFEEVTLPKGEQTIGLKWVFAYKKNAEGTNIFRLFLIHCVDLFRTWVVLMRIGLLIRLTVAVSLGTCFSSRALWSLGLLSDKN